MSEHEPTGYPVSVEVSGRTWSGRTTVPAPPIPCCVDQLRRASRPALLAAAVHEAGHAVTALHAGMPPVDLEIEALPPCLRCGADRARGANLAVGLDTIAAHETLLVLAAGVQAELAWAQQQGPVDAAEQWAIELGGLDDQQLARDVADSLTGVWQPLDYSPPGAWPKPWNWPHQQQRARARVFELWPQIETVATRLFVDHRVPADDLPRLVLG
ncbi:hypothetical protein [Streptacidiphilus anmyonensis]|uniref:hypothetical protein n=1 Tax=Streptacidiphilus anmyonensis TaxID=405782 RepID=UPI0005AB8C67|nr:hypothetical protein [Streptacidiphilus anmyonensis]